MFLCVHCDVCMCVCSAMFYFLEQDTHIHPLHLAGCINADQIPTVNGNA